MRDVEPGEIILIDKSGLRSIKPFASAPYTPCVFEFIYFARPDSTIFGANVYQVRKNLGAELAREHPIEADIVIPVPDSGVPAAIGHAEESGIPFQMGIIRNHYVGRTFIEPQEAIRHFGVKIKLNAVKDVIKGKRVVVIDDSIVRGTTSRKIIKMVRNAGAKEVHMLVSSPPSVSPCYYGIDTPTKQELIASSHSLAFNAVKDVIKGKRVVVIDDSIVRGTTSRKIIKMVRNAGAKEVHMLVSSPPSVSPCYYGIDTPTKQELIASSHSIEEIRKYITADSIGYLSLEGLYKAVSRAGGSFCDACFTSAYPLDFPEERRVPQLKLFA